VVIYQGSLVIIRERFGDSSNDPVRQRTALVLTHVGNLDREFRREEFPTRKALDRTPNMANYRFHTDNLGCSLGAHRGHGPRGTIAGTFGHKNGGPAAIVIDSA